MITIYAVYNLPPPARGVLRDIRAIWACEELGAPYEFHWMDLMTREYAQGANLEINPFGKVPSIVIDGHPLFESGAIVSALFDKFGRGPMDSRTRALSLQWSFAALSTLEPPIFEIFLWDTFWRERTWRDERRAEVVGTAKKLVSALEGALGEREYLLGSELSAPDILMASALRFGRGEASLFDEAPRTRAYLERCDARPAFQRALAKQGVGPVRAA